MKFLSAIGSFFTGLPIKVWLYLALLVSAYIGYQFWHHHVFAQGAASVQVKFDAYIAQAQAAADKAKADQDALQAKLDAESSVSNKALSDQFKALTAKLEQLKAMDHVYVPKNPLPPDCKLDPDRVAQANAAFAR